MTDGRPRYFAIIGGMRTGSNLLARNLNQIEGIKCHGELFNPAFVGKLGLQKYLNIDLATREIDPFKLIAAMVQSDTAVLHGFRIFQGHDPRVLAKVLTDPECCRIFLERDPLESYLSLKIAEATGQWMLRDEKKRRAEQVNFNIADFERFSYERAEFSAQVRRAMQADGLTGLWVDYAEVNSLGTLRGIAKYLGVATEFANLHPTILQQNPGSAADKVTNPEDLPEGWSNAGQLRPELPVLPPTARLIAMKGQPIVFAPIRGCFEERICDWLRSLASPVALGQEQELLSGLERKAFAAWRRANPAAIMFTCIRHPLERAFDAFLTHIADGAPQPFANVQRQLAEGYDLQSTEAQRDDPMAMRRGFHKFLGFLERNLTNNSNVRVDHSWASQSAMIGGYGQIMPLSLVARAENWTIAAAYLAKLAGVDEPPSAASWPGRGENAALLAAFCDAETETLSRRAYATDYTNFGWQDWGQAA